MSKIDLKYATDKLGFFTHIRGMRAAILCHKNREATQAFDKSDEYEVGGRGGPSSYLVFPELKQLEADGGKITTTVLRNVLARRNITDPAFQNKILNFTLQSRSGLHFGIMQILGDYVARLANNPGIEIEKTPQNYTLKLKTADDGTVNLVLKNTFVNQDKLPLMQFKCKFNLSPTQVIITTCHFKKLHDSPLANTLHTLLKANQQNCLQQLVTFLRHCLGFNDELRLEHESDKVPAPAP
jgi:hypothetical protein